MRSGSFVRWVVAALVAASLLTGCAALKRLRPPGTEPIPEPVVEAPPAVPAKAAEPPRVQLQPDRVLQGDLATLRIDQPVPGEVKVRVEVLTEQPRVFRLQGLPVALIGFPAAARTGQYPVTVTWEGGEWQGQIEVVRKAFTEDRLVVTEEQTAIYYDPRQEAEWRKLFTVRSRSHPTPYWGGPFQVPLAGDLRITTYFGEIRFVNGVETGRHSGIDFGAPTGTPVFAPAFGTVVLAERLIVTGWSLVIDHGMNLFTVYYHCDRLLVQEGEFVRPGQQIATVGNTGFSTGPHLHWTASIGNIPIDPWPLTQTAPLGIEAPPANLPERSR